MTDGENWGQAPQYPTQGYGQQDPESQPWQPQHYDPAYHQQRVAGGQSPFPAQGQPWPEPGHGQHQSYPGQPPYAPGPPPQVLRRKRHAVRNVLAGVGGLIVVIIGISVAQNAGHPVKTSGTTGTTGTTGISGQTAAAARAPATARVGSAITLSGNDSGEKVGVTVTKVISSASPGDEFTSAPAGDRLYAVQFRLDDTGSAAYSDAPSNGAEVVDSSGQSYDSSLADTASGCASFPGTENIAPGASGLGCIIFEVPKAAKITEVQFTLDSGMGPQTGQWGVG